VSCAKLVEPVDLLFGLWTCTVCDTMELKQLISTRDSLLDDDRTLLTQACVADPQCNADESTDLVHSAASYLPATHLNYIHRLSVDGALPFNDTLSLMYSLCHCYQNIINNIST